MADTRMPDELFQQLLPYLAAQREVGSQGGRPQKDHFTVMKVIWHVLVTDCRWEDVPLELGCSGRTAHRRLLAWEKLGVWDKLHDHLLKLLNKSGKLDLDITVVDSVIVRSFGGGESTGPSPVDRRKLGTKHTLMVDQHGVPVTLRSAPANASDHTHLVPIVSEYPKVGGKPGRPKEKPEAVIADRGYDGEPNGEILRWMGIKPLIAKRRTPHGSGLGRARWVVERTISWLKGLRRMRVRYDRLAIIQEAWNSLALAIICFRMACQDCTS